MNAPLPQDVAAGQPVDPARNGRPVQRLDVSGLRKSYGARQVVQDVHLAVEAGEVVGLLGPNGAGKTTSFYMIVGLVRADAAELARIQESLQAFLHRQALGLRLGENDRAALRFLIESSR